MTTEQFQDRVLARIDELQFSLNHLQVIFDRSLLARKAQQKCIDEFIDEYRENQQHADNDSTWWRDGREPPY